MRRNKNKYIIFSLTIVLVLMTIGFAGYSQRLDVSETSKVTTSWDISITDIETIGGTATNNANPSFDNLTASFDVNFKNMSDYIEYDVTVTNNGSVIANLNKIDINNSNSDIVSMTYDGISVGDTLPIGESKTFTVKLLYKGGSGEGTSEIELGFSEEASPEEEIIIPQDNMVVYNASENGGSSAITEKYYSAGEEVDLSINASKTGYTFIGWNTNKDATNALNTYTMGSEGVTLYAIYQKDIKVTYQLSEGVYSISKTEDTCTVYNKNTECTFTLPDIEVNDNYVVGGWYEGDNKLENTVTISENKIYISRAYDTNPATLTVSTSKTSKSITVVANASATSGIKTYEYSNNGGTSYIQSTSNTHTFNELTHDTPYSIKVRVTTNGNVTTTSETVSVRTTLIDTPTFAEVETNEGKTVTITYPEGCGTEYTCSYIKDDENETTVTTPTINVSFTDSGTLIAKINDGKNYITSSSYTVEVIKNAAGMLKKTVVTRGDGLYADEYEEGRYVYKGASPANYITFNGEKAGWRIISVEADGTIKIIRNSIIDSMAWDENGTNTWSSSTLKTYLNGTYKGAIDTTYIQPHNFPIGAVTSGNSDLAAQITAEKSSIWNGDIGLMTVGDYLRANTNMTQCGSFSLYNSNYSVCSTTNWIATDLVSSQPWTMTPTTESSSIVFHIGNFGTASLFSRSANYGTGIAPVLYLKSDITLSGSGTSGDPYVITN